VAAEAAVAAVAVVAAVAAEVRCGHGTVRSGLSSVQAHRVSFGSTSRPNTSIHSRWLRPTLCRYTRSKPRST